jgi:DNA-binding transcriptional ArsR family regulator
VTKSLRTILDYKDIRCRNVSDSGEETYSIMFTSLKHPARRKILRMLAEKPKNFSRILEELGISSSHLTYHLENLGELVTKMDDGRYKLSTFGEAAVLTMKGVEEAPDIKPRHGLALSMRWQVFFAVLMIGLVILASVSYVQYLSLNQLSAEHDQLVADFEQLSTAHDQLLSWGISTDRVVNFLEEVIQLDMTKYHATLERNTVEYRADLGGMAEEILTYTLTSDDSELDVDFRFRNQTLSRYRLNVIEGTPLYIYPQPTNILDVADGLLQRYQNYAGVSYLTTMRNMLKTVDETEDVDITVGDMKFIIVTEGNDVMMQWSHMTSGIDYQAKGVRLTFDNGILEMFNDGFFLFNVGSTEINVSKEEAINIAMDGITEFSWTVGGVEITDFIILEESASADLWPHMRNEPAALIPYWYVTFKLDKIYPGNINSIGVGIWADTGEISAYTTISAG